MRNSLKLITAGALLTGSVGLANAADLRRAPPPPAMAPVVAPAPFYNWSGFYIGIQGGFASGELERTLVTTGITEIRETNGGLIGGTVGFNWQFGNWVFGVEGDYAWADIGRNVNNCFGNVLVTCEAGLDTFGTARVRLGGAWGPVLIYGTGGLAFGDHFVRVFDNFTGLSVERSEFAVGWTAGGGIEWGFLPGWSFKAEALFFDLELDRIDTPNLVFPDNVGFDNRHIGVIARAGINYRFNWGAPAGPVVARY
jgi:outer membrane immunogenic protein